MLVICGGGGGAKFWLRIGARTILGGGWPKSLEDGVANIFWGGWQQNFFGGWGGGHQSPLCKSYICCYCSLVLHARYLWRTEADRARCETRMTLYGEHELFTTVARSEQQMPENNQQLRVSIRVSMYDVINLPVDWRIRLFLV